MECQICKEFFSQELTKFSYHLKTHKVKAEDYTLKYIFNNDKPLCAANCGLETSYQRFNFKKYCGVCRFSQGGIIGGFKSGQSKRGEISPKEIKEKRDYRGSLEEIECLICHKFETGKKRLTNHIYKFHEKMNSEEYTKKYIYNGRNPGCLYCGVPTSYRQLKFSSYCKDHDWVRNTLPKNFNVPHRGQNKENNEMLMALSKKFTGEGNPFYGKTHSEETKEKISKTKVKDYIEGNIYWSVGVYFSTKMKKEIYYRSSYELKHLQNLDQDPQVKEFKYEPFALEYLWEGTTHRYIPDFLVTFMDDHRQLQEIGVKKIKLLERNILKKHAAERWCQENNVEYVQISYEKQ